MKRKNICINLLPVILSLLSFLFAFVFKIAGMILITQTFIFYIAPLFYGLYNYFASRNIKHMVKLYAISLISQVIGLSMVEILMYMISSDYNDFMETPAILLINLLVTIVIDIVFLMTKFIINRFNNNHCI